jgi:methylmalonyl-CoA mutase N-terminal domain/subunit
VEEQINEARYKLGEAIATGEHPVVGVNIFQEENEEVKINIFRQASDMQVKRIRYAQDYKRNRDQEPVKRALEKIYDLVKRRPEVNLFQPIMEAVEAKATIQEICDAMRQAANFVIPS